MRKPRQRSIVRPVKQQRRPAAVFPEHRTPSPTPSSPAPEPPGRRIRSGSKFFSEEEEELLIKLHALLGNRWSLIAGRLPGRTGTEVESHWNLTMRRKLKRTGVVNHRSMALLEPADDKHANHHLSSNEDCVSDAGSYCPIQQEHTYGLNLELTLSTPSLYFRGKEQVTD